MDGGQPMAANFLSFNPAGFELPEALSFRNGDVYVSMVALGQIVKVSYPGAMRSVYAQLPVTATNFTLGSAFDSAGNLYVGVAAGNPMDIMGVAAAGVYRIGVEADGGAATPMLWASGTTNLKFPNGLSFDPAGNLYVSDSAEGAIYKFTSAGALGTAMPWATDALLTGSLGACPGTVQAFPIGANGIFAEMNDVWTVNTDRGLLVRVRVVGNGAAGMVSAAATNCALLEGVDGMRPDPRDPANVFMATNNAQNTIVTVSRTGQVATVLTGKPPFYSPADLVNVNGATGPTVMMVANASFAEAFAPPDAGVVPNPSLVTLTIP
jgi:hypothetical protein